MAVVVAGIEEGEFRDRGYLTLPGRQEELIRRVAATGKPVVVVLIGGSAIVMSEWLDQVPAVLNAWYPGETKEVSFLVDEDDLSMLNQSMQRVVEPGDFRLMIGRSCKDIRLREVIRVEEWASFIPTRIIPGNSPDGISSGKAGRTSR